MTNNQPLLFLGFVQDNIAQDEFPGASTINLILEVLLVSDNSFFVNVIKLFNKFSFSCQQNINQPNGGEFQTDVVIDTAASTFNRILQKFPPCWLAANNAYRSLVTKTCFHSISESHKFKNEFTMFTNLLSVLNDLIQPSSLDKKIDDPKCDAYDSFNDSLEFKSFQAWEKKHNQKFAVNIFIEQ